MMIIFVLLLSYLAITPTTATTCPPSDFTCSNGECVESTYRCDESFDCSDRSDEDNCPTERPLCPEGLYLCDDGECAKSKAECNDTNTSLNEFSSTVVIPPPSDTYNVTAAESHISKSEFSAEIQTDYKSSPDITSLVTYSSFSAETVERTMYLTSMYDISLQSVYSSFIVSMYPATDQSQQEISSNRISDNFILTIPSLSNTADSELTPSSVEVVTSLYLLETLVTSSTVHSLPVTDSTDKSSIKFQPTDSFFTSYSHSLSETLVGYETSSTLRSMTLTDVVDNLSTKLTSKFSVLPSVIHTSSDATTEREMMTKISSLTVTEFYVDRSTQEMTSYHYSSQPNTIMDTMSDSSSTVLSILPTTASSFNRNFFSKTQEESPSISSTDEQVQSLLKVPVITTTYIRSLTVSSELASETYSSVLATSESIPDVSTISTAPTVNITASNQISNDTSYLVVIIPFVITVLVILIGFGSLTYRYMRRIGAKNNYELKMPNEAYSTDSLYRGWPLSCRCATRNHRGKWIPLQDSYHWN